MAAKRSAGGARAGKQARRTARAAKREARERTDEVWPVVIDYRAPVELEQPWTASVRRTNPRSGREHVEEVHSPDAHGALHAALDSLERLTSRTGAGFASIHQLDGDTSAWAELVAREGFMECASSGMSRGSLLFDDGR